VHLKGLAKLQTLNLMRTKITDAGLVHLRGLTNLQMLNLSYTQITDAGLVRLYGLTKLQRLDFYGNNLERSGGGATGCRRLLRQQDHRRWHRRPAEGVAQLQDLQVAAVSNAHHPTTR